MCHPRTFGRCWRQLNVPILPQPAASAAEAQLFAADLGPGLLGWREQAIGLTELWVDEKHRRSGFGQTLIVEVIKKLRQETITRVTANIRADDDASVAVFRSAGFNEIDRGVVYRAS